jgi:uncharacterized Zn finger protein (UPF0148 family)
MAASIACICGYQGPSVAESGSDVCPICRTPAVSRDENLHIPCPRGHVLKVSESMLGQRVVCPKCNQFFVLAAEASVERRREMDRLRHEQDTRRARLWLSRAIWAAVLVVVSLASLIVVSALPK